MAPPLAPHRFLASGRPYKPDDANSQKQAPARVANNVVPSKIAAEQNTSDRAVPTARTGSSSRTPLQFAQTPRFAFGRGTQVPSSTPRPSIVSTQVSSSLRVRREDVEEVGSQEECNHEVDNRRGRYVDDEQDTEDAHGQDPSDIDMHLGENGKAATATVEYGLNGGITWSQELPFSPKRRKLRQQQRSQDEQQNHRGPVLDALGTPARPIFHRPTVPASASKHAEPASSIPHFVPAEAPSTGTATSSRPRFIRPPDETDSAAPPLPEMFSPHRRGEKFVPGGMAATVQQWILQAGQDALASRRLRQQHDEFVMIVKVKEIHGNGGPMVISGCKVGEEETDIEVMLSAHVMLSSSRGSEVGPGSIIGIRAPVWEVVGPDGRTMTVGADWRLLPT